MANEKEPTPRKRAPRKKPAPTKPVEAAEAEVPDVAGETSSAGREVMTTTSRDVDTTVGEPTAGPDTAAGHVPTQRDLNRAEVGQLYLHTRSRDIAVILGGDAAARVMSMFAGTGRRAAMRDLVHPELANMLNLWVSIDLREVVALSWIPGLPSRADHVMTVDPPAPDAESG